MSRILLVEDDPQIVRLFCKQLRASNHACDTVCSVKHALQYINTYGLPDLIILDLELSDGYGTDVLDCLAPIEHAPHIIVVSANAFSSQFPLDVYNVEHVLVKPVSPRGLSALVGDMLAESATAH